MRLSHGMSPRGSVGTVPHLDKLHHMSKSLNSLKGLHRGFSRGLAWGILRGILGVQAVAHVGLDFCLFNFDSAALC